MQVAKIPPAQRAYFDSIETELSRLYEIAKQARRRGLDPDLEPESKIVKSLAERVEKLVGPDGVAKRIMELSHLPREVLAIKIAEEIVYGRYGHLAEREAAEQALKTSLAILTEGVTAAPLQGVVNVAIKRNRDRSRYLAIYFAGPIRSAGGTEQGLCLVIGDLIRRMLGLDLYKPTEEEVRRFIEEVRLYEREVARFQYRIPDELLEVALRSIPVEVTGVPTDPVEVSSFRDLPRVETNRLRGGALLVLNDGLIGRSRKIWKIIEELSIDGWGWLKSSYVEEDKLAEGLEHLREAIAGRPIFSLPGKLGGFRLRYGRARNTGLAAVGIHPATMVILHEFLAVGTQLCLNLPSKAAIVTPVDTIEPPTVKLKNGTVRRLEDIEEARSSRDQIDEILFLGDVLASLGDFVENNRPLAPPGYCEEWWAEDSAKVILEKFGSLERCARSAGIAAERLREFIERPLHVKPTAIEAVKLARLGVPLHPKYTHFWSALTPREVRSLRRALSNAKLRVQNGIVSRIEAPLDSPAKALLEKAVIPHEVFDETIVVSDEAPALGLVLALTEEVDDDFEAGSALDYLRQLSGVDVRDKAGTFVGARMGRPEKAEAAKTSPPVHVLFPVGLAGGARRNIAEVEEAEVELVRRRCQSCRAITFSPSCPLCGARTSTEKVCSICHSVTGDRDRCPVCNAGAISYEKRRVPIGRYFRAVCEKLKTTLDLVKGVRGLASNSKIPEPLEKGILRAKHELFVFKDGTIRFNLTNAPLTHFSPEEVGTPCEALHRLGYTTDIEGKPLRNPGQICELKIQDIVISKNAAEYLVRVSQFVDELLEKFYGLPRYYDVRKPEDLIGHLVVALSPHTLVGIVGRIIGLTDANACFAHPIFHAAKRRDCDGDEDSVMLALDVLLNFSQQYLPAKVGSLMDTPLLITPIVDPSEVDKEAHNMDIASRYSRTFYERALKREDAKLVAESVGLILHRLGTGGEYEGLGYTHETTSVSAAPLVSAYKSLETMAEKVVSQLALAKQLRSVEVSEVLEAILRTHLIPDVVGNLRAFTSQRFRCKRCNRKYRRPPLKGSCSSCGGELTLTIHRGTIEKYVNLIRSLVKEYGLPSMMGRLDLVTDEIAQLFPSPKERQVSLIEFMR